MTIGIAYVLGCFTFPIGYALTVVLAWAFGKSNRSSDGCSFCAAAGYRSRGWDFYKRRRLAVWISDQRHRFVTARRRGHRIAWQANYDSYIPGGNLHVRHAAAQKKYGWPKREARNDH